MRQSLFPQCSPGVEDTARALEHHGDLAELLLALLHAHAQSLLDFSLTRLYRVAGRHRG